MLNRLRCSHDTVAALYLRNLFLICLVAFVANRDDIYSEQKYSNVHYVDKVWIDFVPVNQP